MLWQTIRLCTRLQETNETRASAPHLFCVVIVEQGRIAFSNCAISLDRLRVRTAGNIQTHLLQELRSPLGQVWICHGPPAVHDAARKIANSVADDNLLCDSRLP